MKKGFFVVAAIIIVSQANSQQDSSSLDPVIVTANKFPTKSSMTGKVITVITREQLERSGGKDLAQLLNEQAGVYINGANSNPGKDKSVFLRGARVDHTLITIDGIPVYDPSGIGGNFDIRNIAIEQIERIEILKGSQSTLYGSDAIAGVINIISRKPMIKTVSVNALASYGSNNSIRGNAGISGKSGMIDYQTGLTYFKTDGINEATRLSGVDPVDKDGYEQKSAQVGFGINPSSQIRIQPFFRYTDLEGDLDQGSFVDELDYTYRQKSWQAGLRNEFGFGKSKLTVLYNYNSIDRLYIDDSLKSRNGFNTFSRGSYTGSEHFADAYIHFPINNDFKLTGGVDFRKSVSTQEYFSVNFFGSGTNKLAEDSLQQDQYSVYAALNYAHANGLGIEAGGRLNIHSEYGSHPVFNVNPFYFWKKRVKFFANFSSAYRTPSLYQLYSEYGNRELKPEAAHTLEGGLQYFSPDKQFNGRAVVFYRSVKDLIFFYYNSATFQSQYINQDKQKDYGVELEFSYNIAKNTVLKTFYTYTTGKITTVQGGKDTTYFNLLRRPKTTYGLHLGSQLCSNFYISTNLLSVGEREDQYFDSNTFQSVQATLKSYLLWDIYLEYGFLNNKLKLFADLRNVTNSSYTEVSGFNTLGFNGYGGVRINF